MCARNYSLICLFFLVLSSWCAADEQSWRMNTGGNAKYTYQLSHFPDDSINHITYGDQRETHLASGRFKVRAQRGVVELQGDYQALWLHDNDLMASAVGLTSRSPYPDDSRRFFDFTKVLSDDDSSALVHRLDRFSVGINTDKTVLRIGRQVISWGNGLLFNPVDFFNPFDPAALDTEYKVGDDMVYGQYAFSNGADLQSAWVVRRNAQGDVSSDESSVAIKYHGWLDSITSHPWFAGAEIDMVLATHYSEELVALGLVKSLGDALWRSDLMAVRTDDDTVVSFVTNFSYSWMWWDKNFSGSAEYFYNGFGLTGDISLPRVLQHPALYERLARGELYTMGRHYLGFAANIELTPLWHAGPTLLINPADSSALLQLSLQHNMAQNWQILGAINLPLGSTGTEYGGIDSGLVNSELQSLSLATDYGVFFQLAYYF